MAAHIQRGRRLPKFLENKLKAQARAEGMTGAEVNHYAFGAMNNRGLMHGNQITAKGEAVEAKHQRDVAAGRASSSPKRQLHPALAEHGRKVKAAHQHLSTAMPGFRQLHPVKQLRATQEYVRQQKKNGY